MLLGRCLHCFEGRVETAPRMVCRYGPGCSGNARVESDTDKVSKRHRHGPQAITLDI